MRVGAQMWEEVCDILKKMVPQNGNKTATIFRSRKRDRLGICSKQNQCPIYRLLVSDSVLENGTAISYLGAQRARLAGGPRLRSGDACSPSGAHLA